MAERGALAEAKTADEGSTAAQCAYRPWGVSAVDIYIHLRVGASYVWMSDITTTSGWGSDGFGGAAFGLGDVVTGDMPP